MRTESSKGVLVSIFVIASLLTSVALLNPGWTSLTSASSEAQIWTEDAEGNIRTDFEPDETVYICGSGFNLNVQIVITITKPDNTVFQDSTLSDGNGNFIYPYLLNGIRGTYYVTATGDVNSASTTFEDSPKLQGFDRTTGKWTSGLLSGWKELDWVPYRIRFRYLPEGTSSYTFNVYHNNLLDNKDGIDRLRYFRVGDENGNPVTGSVTVSGPFYKTPGKGCDRDIYYALLVSFTTSSPKLTWYLYWQAHLAFGASGWPGSSLHAYTDVSGKQDVPINVPLAPTGSISGSKWGDSDDDGLWDSSENGLPGWTINLYHFDNIANIWVNLENKITDSTGRYTFGGLVAGNYRLCEVLKDNWAQTFPPSENHEVELSEGEARDNINFGNLFMPIVRGVDVFISPDSKSGISENVLTYDVIVRNKGNISDDYSLIVSDNENWDPTLAESSLTVPAGSENTTTLSVKIPRKAFGGRKDSITVTASGTSVENSAAAVANVDIVRGVDVSISPSYQENLPGENLTYIVTVTNLGNVEDNYDLSVSSPEGWQVIFWFTFIDLPPYCSAQSEMIVIIPEDAVPGTQENITVTAVSKTDNTVTDSDSCIAQVKIIREVEVFISPENRIGLGGENLTYTITVANKGNVPDNYALENIDTLGWGLSISEDLLEIENGMSQNVTLTVAIPDNAIGRTLDNITVTATSQENENVWDSASCLAQVRVAVGVDVRIEPSWQRYFVGENLSYAVTVINTGNVPDNYTLTVEDNAGWGPWLSENRLENIWPGENKPATLIVTIYENAVEGTEDNIIVKATSAENAEVSENASCIAQATVPKAEFTFLTLYKTNLDANLLVDNGSKIVAKFYRYYDMGFQAESVIVEFTPPKHVENTVNIPHPRKAERWPWGTVQEAKLVLTTDNTEEEIYTIASFVVRKIDLEIRFTKIPLEWFLAPTPAERTELETEFTQIPLQWFLAPS